jgi:hypothetical protein
MLVIMFQEGLKGGMAFVWLHFFYDLNLNYIVGHSLFGLSIVTSGRAFPSADRIYRVDGGQGDAHVPYAREYKP